MSTTSSVSHLLLSAIAKAARLDADGELDLIARYRNGDQAAFGHLILSNTRLAINRAHALKGYGLPANDLVSEGVVGLLEAAARFDPNRDTRFSTYATWWIRATTTEFVLKNWSIVRTSLSGEQKALFFNVRRLRTKLQRDPTVDPSTIRTAIATAMGVSPRDVELMEAHLGGDVALNAPAPWDEDGVAEVGDFVADPASLLDDVGGVLDHENRLDAIRDGLDRLDDTERLIIGERWLVSDVAPLSALGEYLGISAARVKKIEIAALAKLQAAAIAATAHRAAA